MKQKKTNRVALLLHWAGEQKVWLFLAVLLAMAGGLCIVVPYIEIYRLMDAAFGGTCTEELVVRVVAAVAAAVVLRFVLFGASGVVSHKGAYGALFKVRCMVAEHMAKVPLGALNERRTGDIKTVLNEDIEKLELFLAHNLPDLVCYLVGPVVVFAYLMTVNIPLALISLVPLVLAAVVMAVMFLKGSLTASAFLLFLYVGSMYLTEIRPLQELGTNFANVLNAVTKAKEILDVPIYEGGTDFPQCHDIELRNVRFSYDDKTDVLQGVNLKIRDGERLALVGQSGAGKSTLVRCMNLLERPTSGTVIVDGKDMTALSEKELRLARRNVTMIFQSFNLLMQRTVLKNVCFPMELSGTPAAQARKRALELLDLVGLREKADAYPSQLSGGQKQRVAIARALATDPKVLLCDEATSALDPTTTASILALLKDLNEKLGVTVVVITHQMSVIEEICSRVAILDGGVVAEQGKVEDIFSNPHTDAARRLVYPGGVSLEQYPAGTHAVRVAFNGGTAYQPLIASLAIDLGVKVNILGADTRNIEGRAFGTMLLGLPDDPNEAAKALSYIRAQPNVSAEEVEYHV